MKQMIEKYQNVTALLIHIQYKCILVKYNKERTELTQEAVHYFYGGTQRVYNLENFDDVYNESRESISEKIAKFIANGSDWIFEVIQEI